MCSIWVNRISQVAETQTGYFLPDALGSVRQMTDEEGEVTLTQSYTPYGEVLESQGTATTAYAFTGESYDPLTGLVYLRARYYASREGRFVSKDTWEGIKTKPLSFNQWNYGYSNPVKTTDPSGHSPTNCYTDNGANTRNLTGWLVREMYAQNYQWPVANGIGLVVGASNSLINAATQTLASSAIESFRKVDFKSSRWKMERD